MEIGQITGNQIVQRYVPIVMPLELVRIDECIRPNSSYTLGCQYNRVYMTSSILFYYSHCLIGSCVLALCCNVHIMLLCHKTYCFSWSGFKIYRQFNVHHQYSFYVVRVCGVRPILMTLSYQEMGARDVVQIIMNHFQ